jgi:hypothetical protein
VADLTAIRGQRDPEHQTATKRWLFAAYHVELEIIENKINITALRGYAVGGFRDISLGGIEMWLQSIRTYYKTKNAHG